MRVRAKLTTLVAALAAGVFATAAIAAVNNYENGPYEAYVLYGAAFESSWNEMAWNRVYRPAPRYYTLYYTDGTYAYQYDRQSDPNPFWHNQAGGYRRSVCMHSQDGGYWGPTTCQYGT